MKEICETRLCTGCTACKSICPKKAIRMEENHEGFFYPVMDETLCVDCGLCQKVCPINHFDFSNTPEPVTYAVMAEDELRKESSSGGFFPVLAEEILSQGGVVAGAAFDEAMVLKHVLISSKDQLGKLKGSKYLQSQMLEVFCEIKDALIQGRKVLFTGTPCQVAGVKNFIGKEEENLITVDLICYGVPSQKVFDHYLHSEFPGEEVLNVNFRDKKNGWGITTVTVRTICAECSRNGAEDTYMRIVFSGIALRSSCYDCAFTRMPRPGDFTMGDFWGVPEEMNDHKGTSVVLLNNSKAEEIFRKIQSKFSKTKQYPLSHSLQAQPRLSKSALRHPARNVFFKELGSKSFAEVLNGSISSDKNVALLNFHWENVNFGAVLTSFALNRYLNTHGYFAQNIDYIPLFAWKKNQDVNPYFDEFREKNMFMTRRFYPWDALDELNEKFSSFIVGSDQVWRHEFIHESKDAFFFDFAAPDKKLIACAASFGTERINAPADEIEDYQMRLSCFDAIGIREKSGVRICRELGITAQWIADPVFLLSKEEWTKISEQWPCPVVDSDIVFYSMHQDIYLKMKPFLEAKRNELHAAGVVDLLAKKIPVENWLSCIRNCKFFVTDSFHGVCFALLFNKPFVCVGSNTAVSTRLTSLFERLNIRDRYFPTLQDVPFTEMMNEPIDFSEINRKIDCLRKNTAAFLDKALNTPLTLGRIQEKKEILAARHEREYLPYKKTWWKVYFRYHRYKLCSKIFWGKRREHYERKRKEYRVVYKKYRQILSEKEEWL